MEAIRKAYFKKVFIFLIFISLAGAGFSQYRFSALDAWMEANTKHMGGRAILIIYKDGEIIYNKSVSEMTRRQKKLNTYVAGKLEVEADLDSFTLNSRQLVASCSKWLSAALVMSFVDEGKLRLSDTVGEYLPILSQHGKCGITIGECLSHLTGIKPPPLKKNLKEMLKTASMDEAIERIAGLPMEGEPGKVFNYSNVGLQIAGAVLEKISGQSFQNLFAERIAKPMGLEHTDFGNRPVALPAGGASSTPGDYLRFLTMILHRGNYNGHQILSEQSIRDMEINRVGPDVKISFSPSEAEGLGYGYGVWVAKNSEEGKPVEWATSPGLFGSFPWVENKENYCAFLMTFYLKSKGRNQRYISLKQLVDQSLHE